MIKAILWDVDGTLLDFKAAESAAVKSLFKEFGLGECTDEMVARYSEINDGFWKRLEKGEITKPQVLIGRFEQFFSEYNIDKNMVPEFNERYQLRLGDTIVFKDDGYNIVKSLKGRIKQYAVSNGTVKAQTKKLETSGLGKLFDGVFLSEEVGAEKPNKIFFDKVFLSISPIKMQDAIIVGDSLSGDIKGGNDYGIKTCWYNPDKQKADDKYKIDYVISDLHEIYDVLGIKP